MSDSGEIRIFATVRRTTDIMRMPDPGGDDFVMYIPAMVDQRGSNWALGCSNTPELQNLRKQAKKAGFESPALNDKFRLRQGA
jgi:hypothetical protein